jgi:hypothetical protein
VASCSLRGQRWNMWPVVEYVASCSLRGQRWAMWLVLGYSVHGIKPSVFIKDCRHLVQHNECFLLQRTLLQGVGQFVSFFSYFLHIYFVYLFIYFSGI